MNKSTLSLLLAAMMATSGFAIAQTPMKAGTDGGSGPSAAEKAAPGNMPNARADVKAQAAPMKAGIQGGSGASPDANPNTAGAKASMTSAQRKAARAERKAARKAKRDAAMASSAKPAAGMTEGKGQ